MGNKRFLSQTPQTHEQYCQSLQVRAITAKWEHASGAEEEGNFSTGGWCREGKQAVFCLMSGENGYLCVGLYAF